MIFILLRPDKIQSVGINWLLASLRLIIHVTVPNRNLLLFRCIFQVRQQVWCAIALSFRWGRGSYAMYKCMNIWCIYEVCMSPALSGSSVRQTQQCAWNTRRNNIYPGLPHTLLMKTGPFVSYFRMRLTQINTLIITNIVCIYKATTNWITISRPPPARPSWAHLIFLLLW